MFINTVLLEHISFVEILSMAAFVLRQQSAVIGIEIFDLQSLKYLPSGPLQKKLADPCNT